MKCLLLLCFTLGACSNLHPPKTYTPPPSLNGAKHGVTDAKDMLSRAQLSNSDIAKLIKELEGLKK